MDTPSSNFSSSAQNTPRSSSNSAPMTPSSSSGPSTQSALKNHADRIFDPIVRDLSGKIAHVDTVLHFDGRFTYIPTSSNTKQIMVAIGGCRYNKRHHATASIGVYFGPGASSNIDDVLEKNDFGRPFFPPSEFAELTACHRALDAVHQSYLQKEFTDDHGNGNLSQVVIKTNSDEVFHGMTRRVSRWEQTNWEVEGQPFLHAEIFKAMQDLTAKLNTLGVQVLFWEVERENNIAALGLARKALSKSFGENALKRLRPLSPVTSWRLNYRARGGLGLPPPL